MSAGNSHSNNHYEVLGVAKGADKATVKRAYRRAAAKAHPDRGGDPVRMALVNKAYETLSDDASRARYDETGGDGLVGMDSLAVSEAMKHINMSLERWLSGSRIGLNSNMDVVRAAKESLNSELRQHTNNASQAKEMAGKLEKAMKKLRYRGKGNDLMRGLFEQRVAACNAAMVGAQNHADICERALVVLEEYEWEVDKQAATWGTSTTSQFIKLGAGIYR